MMLENKKTKIHFQIDISAHSAVRLPPAVICEVTEQVRESENRFGNPTAIPGKRRRGHAVDAAMRQLCSASVCAQKHRVYKITRGAHACKAPASV